MPQEKAILVLSDVFPPQHGGSGKWLHDLYSHKRKSNVIMCVGKSSGYDSQRDAEYSHKIIRQNLHMTYRGVANPRSIARYVQQTWSVGRLAKKNKIAEIHAARPLSEGLVAALIKKTHGIPYKVFVHGEDVNIAKTSRELTTVTKYVLDHSSQVIANSNFSRMLLTDDWSQPAEKICVVHPCVNTNDFSQQEHIPSNPDSLRLLTVGRLQARKGQDTVIQALNDLSGFFPSVNYTIAGDGGDKPRLESMARDLGVEDRVHFIGSVNDSDLRGLYASHDIFVLANRSIGRDVEGFGIVLLEAQAAGLPVIAGNSGGTSDTFIDKKTGFLINATDHHELVETIKNYLSNHTQRERIGRDGRAHVQRYFDWNSPDTKASSFEIS